MVFPSHLYRLDTDATMKITYKLKVNQMQTTLESVYFRIRLNLTHDETCYFLPSNFRPHKLFCFQGEGNKRF